MVDTKVIGLAELQRNLIAFGSDKIVGRIIKKGMAAGARIVRTAGARNARSLGLGDQGAVRDRNGQLYLRYGRIPKSIKIGKGYIPRDDRNAYRLNIVARGQRVKGKFSNKAPHAHFIEYGFHRNGWVYAGRPFLGPAMDATYGQVTEKIRDTMSKEIDKLRFPT